MLFRSRQAAAKDIAYMQQDVVLGGGHGLQEELQLRSIAFVDGVPHCILHLRGHAVTLA